LVVVMDSNPIRSYL